MMFELKAYLLFAARILVPAAIAYGMAMAIEYYAVCINPLAQYSLLMDSAVNMMSYSIFALLIYYDRSNLFGIGDE